SGMPAEELPQGSFAAKPLEEAAEPLVRLVRELKPQVMITYDENGGYPHPDHVMCHKISVEAFEAAGDPSRYPAAGEPWQPLKLYYHMTSAHKRMSMVHEALLAEGKESPYAEWLTDWDASKDNFHRVTTRVECGEYFALRDDALRAHATQIDPEGFWFAIPLAVQRDLWPTEEYELARSLADSSIPESDLFEGAGLVVPNSARK
ncbi:MAG: mycothiol conjugate amidase Mca, partial [Mycobacteriales bacterium]